MYAEQKVFQPAWKVKDGPAATGEVQGANLFHRLGMAEERAELVSQVHDGFPVSVIDKLAAELSVSQQALLKVAGIATATLTRRRKSEQARLSPQESDRLYRIAVAYRRALALFEGNEEGARQWFTQPAKALGGESPFEYLDTEAGADEVRDLIGRLEHGVYT